MLFIVSLIALIVTIIGWMLGGINPNLVFFLFICCGVSYLLMLYDKKVKAEKKEKANKERKKQDGIKVKNKLDYLGFKVAQNFNATKEIIKNFNDDITSFGIDENSKKVIFYGKEHKKIYNYNDILESKIIEDGMEKTVTSRGSLIGRALVGAVIAGGVGAIIGGLSSQKEHKSSVSQIDLQIVINDIKKPVLLIPIERFTTNGQLVYVGKEDQLYKKAYDEASHWHHLISVIIKKADEEDEAISKSPPVISVTEEIAKLSELLMKGYLTKEEFEKQKAIIFSNQNQ